ncbi:MAG: lysine--tRNA ligase [Mycoplasmatales bacterium]|nr:lysine--tRNA ligase [Mycoplasmatales bacterium]
MKRKLTELEIIRRNKLKAMIKEGINPYSRNIDYSDNSSSLKEKYDKFSKDELHEKQFRASTVGRVLTTRGPFIIGKDSSGPIQAYIAKKEYPEVQKIINFLDIGDIVRFEGVVMKTNTGTITIRAEKFEILSKSLKPLPEKFHGLKDVEERYRRRYLDLIMNENVVKTFKERTKIIKSIREYFDNLDYMEVDTPVLQDTLGGASAAPFETFHNALDMPFYLRIATELPLKKLIVGGIDRVYEIGRIFRNEGIDTTHNPEFTSVEFYEAYSNMEGMIKRTENVFVAVANALNKNEVEYAGQKISFKTPFARIDMVDEVSKKSGKDFRNISFEEAKEVAKKYDIKIESYFTTGHIINELFEELVEDSIVQPTFVTGHPIEISPLASKNLKDPRFTERSELFILGKEYANLFTELHDPIDQLSRFTKQLEERKSGNEEATEIDMDFVESLEYGMPPTGGCGIGVDRLVMLFTGQTSIREVLLFPHLKHKKEKGVENE